MTNPLPQPEQKTPTQPTLVPDPVTSSRATFYDWKAALGAHWRWWLHRRRLQWKQTLAAVLITLASLLLWLALVEVLD